MSERHPRHLLTLWNPSYANDAMEAHLRVLLDWTARADRSKKGWDDDVYVWWAKVRSQNRRQELPHANDIIALNTQIEQDIETHLYLTDYRSLYVAHLDEVAPPSLLAESPDEADHMPRYYKGLEADFWFRLADIRRLVADDTPAVIDALRQLRNTRYHDKPVSLYGGMTDLPLIVTCETETHWFTGMEPLSEGRLWAEHDASLVGETERVARELRDNLFGHDVWGALHPATRTFLAAGEAVFRSRRDDPGFDFSGPVIEYAKAVETELNALIFPALRRVMAPLTSGQREIVADGRKLDLGGAFAHQPIGVLKVLLEKNDDVRKYLPAALPSDHRRILSELPSYLEPLREYRNPAAHNALLRREDAAKLREQVLGIGQEGLIVMLARMKLRAGV